MSTSSIGNAMKAWTHTCSGLPPDVLILSSLPVPTITAPTQILIQVSHCALNPGGSIIMQLLPFFFRASPAIPEMDFSGTVVSLGSGVPRDRKLEPGTPVFGTVPVSQHAKSTSGALAEYVVVDHTAIVKKPDAPSLAEVAGLGIAGATALELMKAAKLRPGNSVLVNGASGGIGHLVLQMCQHAVGPNGRVVATCSSRNMEWLEKLSTEPNGPKDGSTGTVQVVDYVAHAPVYEYLAQSFGQSRFDAVIDAVGIQDIFHHSPAFLAEGKPHITVGARARSYTYAGILSSVGAMAKNMLLPPWLGGTPRRYIQVTGVSNLVALEELAMMVGDGTLKVHLDRVVSMEKTQEAYEHLLSGHAQGKIVVAVSGTTKE